MMIYDYIFIGILISFSIMGLFTGFIKGLSKILIILLPTFIAYMNSKKIFLYFNEEFNFYSGYGGEFLASIILFAFTYISIKTIFSLLDKLISSFGLNIINHIVGFIVGSSTGILVGYIFLATLNKFFNIDTYTFNLLHDLINT